MKFSTFSSSPNTQKNNENSISYHDKFYDFSFRNDLSQIETLHELFKKKRRRNKSEYHDRMNRLLEFNWTYLVYLSSAVLLALIIAIIVGIIFFSESLLEYLVFVSITSAVLVILSCIWIIIANTKRKYVKKF